MFQKTAKPLWETDMKVQEKNNSVGRKGNFEQM